MATALPAIGIRRLSGGRSPTELKIEERLSPNFSERRQGLVPHLVVLHFTAMATAELAAERLCDPEAEVSAHYLIAEDGRTIRLVPEAQRAWHAGTGEWRGQDDINSMSIGIELANDGQTPFAARQVDALENLLRATLARWDIPPVGVIAHSDMAPSRKYDPGPRFDWRRLALAGLSVWPEAGLRNEVDFMTAARRFGYPDAAPDAVLAAFRLRFRPWADGPEDATDRAIISELAARFGVDRDAVSA